MSKIRERGSTHVYNVNKISKEEIERMVERCVYEQPPFCNAACPLKLDTRALLKAAADGNFKKALEGETTVTGIVAEGDEDQEEVEVVLAPNMQGHKCIGVVGSVTKV